MCLGLSIIRCFNKLLAAGMPFNRAVPILEHARLFFHVNDSSWILHIYAWQQKQDTAALDELVRLGHLAEAEELAKELAEHARNLAACVESRLADLVHSVFGFYAQLEDDVFVLAES
jgi:hypothetical protein